MLSARFAHYAGLVRVIEQPGHALCHRVNMVDPDQEASPAVLDDLLRPAASRRDDRKTGRTGLVACEGKGFRARKVERRKRASVRLAGPIGRSLKANPFRPRSSRGRHLQPLEISSVLV